MKATQEAAKLSWSQRLAAPHWTVIFFVLTALSCWIVIKTEFSASALMVAPFGLLLVNLGAAIATLPRFRRDPPLLVFHLALACLVILLILARLTYQHATTTLARGETYSGFLLSNEYGPWHGDQAPPVRFTNLGFTETYPAGGDFMYTSNQVRWYDAKNHSQLAEIRDDYPLIIDGYRIYTSFRGFVALFHWQDLKGNETLGRVELSNTIIDERPAVNDWQLPDDTPVWMLLDTAGQQPTEFAPGKEKRDRVNRGADTLRHKLVLRLDPPTSGEHGSSIDPRRFELAPGQSLELETGTLTYLRLDSWMGYRIVYDPTQPWLIGTIIVGVLSLTWFYLRQIFRRGSWDSDR